MDDFQKLDVLTSEIQFQIDNDPNWPKDEKFWEKVKECNVLFKKYNFLARCKKEGPEEK